MEQNSRDPPETVEPELNHDEINFLDETFQKIEIDGVTYYIVTM